MYTHIIPKKLNDTIHYKDGYKILSMLQHKNHNNMIIYGISKIGNLGTHCHLNLLFIVSNLICLG